MQSNLPIPLERRRTFAIQEMADLTGLSYREVRNAIYRGQIHATRIGRRWLIPVSELARVTGGEA